MKEYPYWLRYARHATQNLQSELRNLPSRADVLIVGAGYTGLSAARHLARAGASVVVVEREQVGWGASSRNGGQVLTGMKVDAAALVERFGQARARQLFEIATESMVRLETLIAEDAIACDYERTGHLCAAFKPAHFDAFLEEQALLARVFDHQVHLVPRADQRAEIGSDAYYGLLVDERSGGLNPARFVQGLAGAAIARGAAVVTGVGVTGIDRHGDRWRVSTTGGEVEAGDVLMATNGYTDGASPALQRRFIPIGSYIIATEPLAEPQWSALLPRRRMAFDSKHFLYYFRVTPDRRLLFGGRAEFGRPDAETTRRAAAILHQGMTHGISAADRRAHRLRLGRERGVHARPDAARGPARRRVLRRRLLRPRRGDGGLSRRADRAQDRGRADRSPAVRRSLSGDPDVRG